MSTNQNFNKMVKHIVLEAKESDIQEFYVGILGGEITRQFTVNEGVASRIFHVPQKIEVFELGLQDMKFELFVHENLEQDSLQHLCVELDHASEIYRRANKQKYRTHLRKNESSQTYFISDNNGNMFEIRDCRECPEHILSRAN